MASEPVSPETGTSMLGAPRSVERAILPTATKQRPRAVALSDLSEEIISDLNHPSEEDSRSEEPNSKNEGNVMLGESRSNQRATPPTSASQRTRAVALSNLDEECLDSLNRQSKEDVFPENSDSKSKGVSMLGESRSCQSAKLPFSASQETRDVTCSDFDGKIIHSSNQRSEDFRTESLETKDEINSAVKDSESSTSGINSKLCISTRDMNDSGKNSTFAANGHELPSASNTNRPRVVTLNDLRISLTDLHLTDIGSNQTNRFQVETEVMKKDRRMQEKEHFLWIQKHIKYKTCCHFVPQTSSHVLFDSSDIFISNEPDVCQCKRALVSHNQSDPFSQEPLEGDKEWDKKQHTKEVPTDTFGEMQFVNTTGGKYKTAKYIRVSPNTKPEHLFTIFTEHWQVEEPNIIISVTGGAQDFNLDPELSRLFKRGLVNAAKNTGAWIITGGTNHGVMSYVGDAIADQPIAVRNSLTLIGFTTWGVVQGRDGLINNTLIEKKHAEIHRRSSSRVPFWNRIRGHPDSQGAQKVNGECHHKQVKKYSMLNDGSSSDVHLNPNHSHFVLVDDGTIGKFGAEIDLWSKFQEFVATRAEIASENNTTEELKPQTSHQRNIRSKVVCLLLEGGPFSLETVYRSLKNGTPVVIAKGSGRAADIISLAKENCLPSSGGDQSNAEFPKELIQRLRNEMLQKFTLSNNDEERESQIEKSFKFLRLICSRKNQNMVTIYSIRDPMKNDLEKSILGALMKALQNKSEPSVDELMSQLQLAVKWNRSDTAAKYILNKNRQNLWPPGFLNSIFLECCETNKYEFVKYFLNNGVSLYDFKFVFQLEPLFSSVQTKSPLMDFFLSKSIPSNPKYQLKHLVGVYRGICSMIGKGFKLSLLTKEFEQEYEKFSQQRKEKEKLRQLTVEELQLMDPPEIEDPTLLFFFWAIIMNYHEMAKLFWALGRNYLSKLLVGMALYKSMAENFNAGHKTEELLANADDFASIAMTMLQQCSDNDENELKQLLSAESSLCKSHSILALAEMANHEVFIAHKDPQLILDEIWSGAMIKTKWFTAKIHLAIVAPLLIPWLLQFDIAGDVFVSTNEDNLNEVLDVDYQDGESTGLQEQPETYRMPHDRKLSNGKRKCSSGNPIEFPTENIPNVFVWLDKIIFFYEAPITKFVLNMYALGLLLCLYTYMVLSTLPKNVFWAEVVLAALILSITTEELRDLLVQRGRTSKKLQTHFTSRGGVWNWMDLLGIIFFWVPFILRVTFWDDAQDVARVLYIMDLFFWFMRILRVFTVSKNLGPIVTIIINMIPKLVTFSLVWIVFMAAFGTIIKAVSQPKRFGDVTPYDVINVVSMSYWQTYGELFLENLHEDASLENNLTCVENYNDDSSLPPCPYWPRLSIYFLVFYMLIGNVLLMNLLIALFTSVYEEVNSRSLTDWKNKRMDLVVEYHTRPLMPPPFTILQHLYMLFTWKRHTTKARLARGLTIKHNEEKLRQLEMFEEECKEEFLLAQNNTHTFDVTKKVRGLEKKVDEVSFQIREMKQTLDKQAKDQQQSLNELSEAVANLTELIKTSKAVSV